MSLNFNTGNQKLMNSPSASICTVWLPALIFMAASLQNSMAQDEPTMMQGMGHSEHTMPATSKHSGDDMHNGDSEGATEGVDHGESNATQGSSKGDMHHSDSEGGMEGMDHNAMPGMDHGAHGKPDVKSDAMDHNAMPGMEHGKTSAMSSMSHGSMQGGSAPADARDPHAYSGGYTLESGPYDLPGPRQLRLADEHNFASLSMDRLEAVSTSDSTSTAYDLRAWYGRDYNRAVLKAEGHYEKDDFEETNTELLWGRAISAYWNTQLGLRYNGGVGPDRTWVAFGIQGLVPYWFEVDATVYWGVKGRTAVNMEAEYDVLITQKLIVQPRVEADAYGKDDNDLGKGSGLSELKVGARLQYGIRREFAPYVGIEWSGVFGGTAKFARAAGLDTNEIQAVAGIHFWF